VPLYATIADELILGLEAYDGPAIVKGIVKRIGTEFNVRYTGQYPEEVAIAQWFVPENLFNMGSRVQWDWSQTYKTNVIAWCKSEPRLN